MTDTTGFEEPAGEGWHHHRHPVTPTPEPAPAPTPVPVAGAPGNLLAETAIGRGTLATEWAEAILTALGAPVTDANTDSMIAWFAAEDNNGSQGEHADGAGGNNPLNVTADSGSFAGDVGSEPSGAGAGHPGNIDFDTPAHGVAAIAEVIRNYAEIAAALKSGAGLIGNPAVSGNLSTWSGGGYSSLS